MNELTFNITYVWLAIAVILLIVEWITLGITTIWFAIGALAAMVLAWLGFSYTVQLAVFFIVSIILFVSTRPLFMKKIDGRTPRLDVKGSVALVLNDITPFNPGTVKLNGEVWMAVTRNGETFYKDETVRVEGIEGVKLIVSASLNENETSKGE